MTGSLSRLAAMAVVLLGLASAMPARAADAPHRVVIQVDENDPARMNLALNNAMNVVKHYTAAGQPVEIKIIAYGPGLTMLRADQSPVAERIRQMSDAEPNITFGACNNTINALKKKEGLAEIALLDGVAVVPSGVISIMELQEQGWSYLRP